MFSRFRNLKPGTLLTHLLVTLAYPAARAITAEDRGLLIFTDALTIIALVLVVCGVAYALVLRGDFDLSGFVFNRGLQRRGGQSYETYKANRREEREAAFNYPLFLGILYLLVSAVLAYGFL